jgi:hypothetical protein
MMIEADLLDRHRAGVPEATKRLIEALLPLVADYKKWHRGKIDRHMDPDDLESVLYNDLCVAVDCLKRNNVTPDYVEQYVRNNLKHSWKDCLSEASEDILFKDGTQMSRGELPESEFVSHETVGHELMATELYESMLAVAETKLEHAIAGLLLAGHETVDIAETFRGIGFGHVKRIIEHLRGKAESRAAQAMQKRRSSGRANRS